MNLKIFYLIQIKLILEIVRISFHIFNETFEFVLDFEVYLCDHLLFFIDGFHFVN